MAHESFEDEEIARILNASFIAVKVDREERPDVDAVYMSVCQAMTGSGGWPLTILMTPGQNPFFAGTYLPKSARYGSMGLKELLLKTASLWETDRQRLLETGESIAAFLKKGTHPDPEEPSRELVRQGAYQLARLYDSKWGGFGQAPKFPTPHNLLFLMQYSILEQDGEALEMSLHTLECMYRGGIFDQIGGGFSRYSTDEKWLVPHFEKMLYDNALLIWAYQEAFRMTGRPLYQTAVRKTIRYVLDELTDPDGGFYCGQDADSDGVEGKYYVFTPEEIIEVLGRTEGNAFCTQFGIGKPGNFEGKSIPNLIHNPDYEELDDMETICRKVYRYRLHRAALHRDDKILTGWNALMITALAKAAFLLDDETVLEAAECAQNFLETRLTNPQGRLFIRYRDGETAHRGQLEDYAFYTYALLTLYETTLKTEYLEKAVKTAEQMQDLFFDSEAGGFYFYGTDAETLIGRPKEVYDGAVPSGNSAAALCLVRLAALTGEKEWQEARDLQIGFLAAAVREYPAGHTFALTAMAGVLYPAAELVCVSSGNMVPQELRTFLRKNTEPNLTVLFKCPGNQGALCALAPFTGDYPIPKEGVQYYLCRNHICSAPTSELSQIEKQIG